MSGRGPLSRHDVPHGIRPLVDYATDLGYEVYRRRNSHLQFRHKMTGQSVFAPGTPSDWRAEKNVRSKLRRSAPSKE